jgi:uncharacterized membrane protein
MKAIIFNENIRIITWVLIGGLLALIFGILQKKSLTTLSKVDNSKILLKTYLFSSLRIIVAALIIFISFSYGMFSGFGCIISFIFFRGVWIMVMVNESKKNIKD